MADVRKTSDPIFDDNRELAAALNAAEDQSVFLDGYRLGYQRGYSKAWSEYRVTVKKDSYDPLL